MPRGFFLLRIYIRKQKKARRGLLLSKKAHFNFLTRILLLRIWGESNPPRAKKLFRSTQRQYVVCCWTAHSLARSLCHGPAEREKESRDDKVEPSVAAFEGGGL
jgi:hypothetical protein